MNKDQNEAAKILKEAERGKQTLPDKEKNILKWSTSELRAYVVKQTSKMSPKNKMKFAQDLVKRIEDEKKKKSS